MSKYVKQFAFILVILCFSGCISHSYQINREIAEENKQLPKVLSDDLRIDSILFSKTTNTLVYYYTMFGDSIIMDSNYDEIQKTMAYEIKKSPSMARFRKHKVNFNYIYVSDKNRDTITIVKVHHSDYQ